MSGFAERIERAQSADQWVIEEARALEAKVAALEAALERNVELLAWWDKRVAWCQARIPDPNDLREVLDMVDDLSEEAGLCMSLAGGRAYDRLRATLEGEA